MIIDYEEKSNRETVRICTEKPERKCNLSESEKLQFKNSYLQSSRTRSYFIKSGHVLSPSPAHKPTRTSTIFIDHWINVDRSYQGEQLLTSCTGVDSIQSFVSEVLTSQFKEATVKSRS